MSVYVLRGTLARVGYCSTPIFLLKPCKGRAGVRKQTMKQNTLTNTSDATAQVAIAYITGWVKKYSFLFARYANWHICIANDTTYSSALDFDVNYTVDSNAIAQEVIEHFKSKGMHADGTNETGRCIYLHKKKAL